MGRVANPHDLLMWFKSKQKTQGPRRAADEASLVPPALDSIALDAYVSEHLVAALDILPAQDMTAALHQVCLNNTHDMLLMTSYCCAVNRNIRTHTQHMTCTHSMWKRTKSRR